MQYYRKYWVAKTKQWLCTVWMDPPGVSNITVHGSDQGFILIRQEATIVTLGTIKNKNKYALLCEVSTNTSGISIYIETKWYSEKIHSRRPRRYRVPHPLTRILPSCLAPLQYVPRQQSVDDCEDRIVCVDGPQSDDIILYRVTDKTSGSIK